MSLSDRLVHDFFATFAPEIEVIVKCEFMSTFGVLFLGEMETLDDFLHVSLVTTAEADFEAAVELVLEDRLVVLEDSAFESLLFLIPDLSFRLILYLIADELMLIYAVFSELSQTESAFNSILLISTCLLRYIKLL